MAQLREERTEYRCDGAVVKWDHFAFEKAVRAAPKELGHMERLALLILASHANGGHLFVGTRKLGTEMHVAHATVVTAMAAVRGAGWVRVTDGGGGALHHYELAPVTVVKSEDGKEVVYYVNRFQPQIQSGSTSRPVQPVDRSNRQTTTGLPGEPPPVQPVDRNNKENNPMNNRPKATSRKRSSPSKAPDGENPMVAEVFTQLKEARGGYQSPKPSPEAAAIRAMLRAGHTPSEIIACWKARRSESWTNGHEVYMMTIQGHIDAWNAAKTRFPTNGHTPIAPKARGIPYSHNIEE